MWKTNHSEPARSDESAAPATSYSIANPLPKEADMYAGGMANHQSFIGRGLLLKGEIAGSGSLLMDGVLEGSIDLRGDRVTLGRHSRVAASVTAAEVVVRGEVRGNLHAADRATVCADGSLIGDVTATRILIEDGAHMKGRVEARLHETAASAPVASQRNASAA